MYVRQTEIRELSRALLIELSFSGSSDLFAGVSKEDVVARGDGAQMSDSKAAEVQSIAVRGTEALDSAEAVDGQLVMPDGSQGAQMDAARQTGMDADRESATDRMM